MKISLLVVVLVIGVAVANNNNLRIVRQLTAPNCANNNQCLLLSEDVNANNNNQKLNQRLTRMTLAYSSVNQQLQAVYSYQQRSVDPITAQTQVNFVSVREWNDADSDGQIIASELGTGIPIVFAGPVNWDTTAKPFPESQWVPFTVAAHSALLDVTCYIAKNDTYFAQPDYVFLTGYGAYCEISVNHVLSDPTHRLVLELNIITNLDGGSVSTSPQESSWSIFTPVTGYTMNVGDTQFGYRSKVKPEGHLAYDVAIARGPFTSFNSNGRTVDFGVPVNNASSFAWNLKFEPYTIGAASSVSASIVVVACALLSLLNLA